MKQMHSTKPDSTIPLSSTIFQVPQARNFPSRDPVDKFNEGRKTIVEPFRVDRPNPSQQVEPVQDIHEIEHKRRNEHKMGRFEKVCEYPDCKVTTKNGFCYQHSEKHKKTNAKATESIRARSRGTSATTFVKRNQYREENKENEDEEVCESENEDKDEEKSECDYAKQPSYQRITLANIKNWESLNKQPSSTRKKREVWQKDIHRAEIKEIKKRHQCRDAFASWEDIAVRTAREFLGRHDKRFDYNAMIVLFRYHDLTTAILEVAEYGIVDALRRLHKETVNSNTPFDKDKFFSEHTKKGIPRVYLDNILYLNSATIEEANRKLYGAIKFGWNEGVYLGVEKNIKISKHIIDMSYYLHMNNERATDENLMLTKGVEIDSIIQEAIEKHYTGTFTRSKNQS